MGGGYRSRWPRYGWAAAIALAMVMGGVGPAAAGPMELHHLPLHLLDVAPEQEEGPHAYTLWSNRIGANMQFSNYKGLEKWCRAYASGKVRERDGMPVLSRMVAGFEAYFRDYTSQRNRWRQDHHQIELWRGKYPHSYCAPVVEAIYWRKYAWHARGYGYADTVSAEGWKLFKQRLRKGAQVLREAKGLSGKTPAWATQLLKIARALQWAPAKRKAIFEQAVARFPHYPPLYFERAYADTPMWGGSWRAVDDDVEAAVKTSRSFLGEGMYARVYWNVFGETDKSHDFDFFKDTLARWPRMRSGFEDLMHHYPKSAWDRNSFAAFACLADDAKTYRRLRPKLVGDGYYSQAWAGNASIDVCDARLGYRQ